MSLASLDGVDERPSVQELWPLPTAFWLMRDMLDAALEGVHQYDAPPKVFSPSWGLVL